MKKTFYTEIAYIFGVICTALGVALMAVADFGVSMVVAPAYIIYLKVSEVLPWFTFGMAEYLFQGFLLLLIAVILRKFRLYYLFSFVTVIIYGFILDCFMALMVFIPTGFLWVRVLCFILGWLIVAFGISLMFHTYISPEVYELFVKELSKEKKLPINRVKTCYDISSCTFAIILSFVFFGFGVFRGVNVGTVICALFNGAVIGMFSKLLEKRFNFENKLAISKFFDSK